MTKKIKFQNMDLFCGCGGVTIGFERAGIPTKYGVDEEPSVKYPYQANSNSKFLNVDLSKCDFDFFDDKYDEGVFRMISGGPPCQPFSTQNTSKSKQKGESHSKYNLMEIFGEIVNESKIDFVFMEEVPGVINNKIFAALVNRLKENGYFVDYKVIHAVDFGIPQTRVRLILFACKHFLVEVPTKSDKRKRTLRDVLNISKNTKEDRFHCLAESSDELFVKRCRQTRPNGGDKRTWDKDLRTKSHQEKSWRYFQIIYARMYFDRPSGTITSALNNRSIHPFEDRQLTIRERALIQTFDADFDFGESTLGQALKMIGNAVPPDWSQQLIESAKKQIIKKTKTKKGK